MFVHARTATNTQELGAVALLVALPTSCGCKPAAYPCLMPYHRPMSRFIAAAAAAFATQVVSHPSDEQELLPRGIEPFGRVRRIKTVVTGTL